MSRRASAMRALNMAMRLCALGAKLGLVLLLALFLSPKDVATYGLVSSVIVFSVYVVGLDYYTYANRALSRAQSGRLGGIIRDQWLLYVGAYVVVVLAAVVLGRVTGLPLQVLAWTVPLIIVEHQAQEVNRILVTVDDQIAASAIMFVRSGLWGVISIVTFLLFESARSIDVVFGSWLVCSSTAVLLGFLRLRRRGVLNGFLQRTGLSIWRGVRVALPFFIGTLAINAMFTVDRFLVGHLVSTDALAAYTVFMSVAGALRSVLDAGVFAFSMPRMLRAGHRREIDELRRLQRRVTTETVLLTGGALVLSFFPGALLVDVILRGPYAEHYWLFPMSVVAVALFCLATPAQQVLYSRDRDFTILVGNLAGLVIFVLAAVALASATSLSVPIGLSAGFGVALVIKAVVASRETRVTLPV